MLETETQDYPENIEELNNILSNVKRLVKKLNGVEGKVTNLQTLAKQTYSKDPVKLTKKKAI